MYIKILILKKFLFVINGDVTLITALETMYKKNFKKFSSNILATRRHRNTIFKGKPRQGTSKN